MNRPTARHTKIVCTIGPASESPEMIEQLAWTGMDAARLNFSHGDHDAHRRVIQCVRRTQDLIGRPLAVIADLQGPKIRIGTLEAPITVQPGDTMMLAPAGEGHPGDFEITFPQLGLSAVANFGNWRVRAWRPAVSTPSRSDEVVSSLPPPWNTLAFATTVPKSDASRRSPSATRDCMPRLA